MHFGFMNITLLYSDHRHVRQLIWLSSGWQVQKYNYIYSVLGPFHTYKRIIWLKFRLNVKTDNLF